NTAPQGRTATITVADKTTIISQSGGTGGNEIHCNNYSANGYTATPHDDHDDTDALKNCFAAAGEGDTIILEAGIPGVDAGYFGYIVNDTLTIEHFLTIKSSQPGRSAALIAGRDLWAPILSTKQGGVLDFTIQDISFDGMVDCSQAHSGSCLNFQVPSDGPWRRHRDDCYDDGGLHNPPQVRLEGRFYFHHNESKHSLCGSGLLAIASNGDFHIENNYFAYNGRDRWSQASGTPWSDGMTVLNCRGAIWKNVFVDNTDIDLVVGGSAGAGSSCSVLDNTIWHGGKFAFAGLNVGNFSPG